MTTIEKNKDIDWKGEVLVEVKKILKEFEDLDIKPTLRTVFYSLVSRNILENRIGHYKSLSHYTTMWRENSLPCNIGKYREVLPMDCFVDETRQIIPIEDDYYTSEEYIERGISHLRYAPEEYIKTVPRWYEQPNYVEVWIEKNAMAGTLHSILEDRHVRIAPMKGFSGIDFLYKNVLRLIEKRQMGKSIHILYFGDYDPAGTAMDKSINEKLPMYGLKDYGFKRISITQKQIKDLKLPRSYKTFSKNDTHVKNFKEENNGEAFQIELDAMQALHPRAFKNLVQRSVDSLFDERIYQEMLESMPSEAEIVGLVRKQMQGLSREFNKLNKSKV